MSAACVAGVATADPTEFAATLNGSALPEAEAVGTEGSPPANDRCRRPKPNPARRGDVVEAAGGSLAEAVAVTVYTTPPAARPLAMAFVVERPIDCCCC